MLARYHLKPWHLVTITPAGKRRLAQADRALRDAEDAFFSSLTQAQRARLHDLLLTLRTANHAQQATTATDASSTGPATPGERIEDRQNH